MIFPLTQTPLPCTRILRRQTITFKATKTNKHANICDRQQNIAPCRRPLRRRRSFDFDFCHLPNGWSPLRGATLLYDHGDACGAGAQEDSEHCDARLRPLYVQYYSIDVYQRCILSNQWIVACNENNQHSAFFPFFPFFFAKFILCTAENIFAPLTNPTDRDERNRATG
jgi:hypothetical protein